MAAKSQGLIKWRVVFHWLPGRMSEAFSGQFVGVIIDNLQSIREALLFQYIFFIRYIYDFKKNPDGLVHVLS